MYYILTSQSKKGILATKDYSKCYDFILKNRDTKIRRIDHTAKSKIMDKRLFLKSYYENVDDKNKFFTLLEIMVTGATNIYDLLNLLGLKDDYRAWKNNFNKIP